MLQAIRDKTTGWIAYLIIFLISVPFALWGVNSYLGGGEVTPAAVVNGEEITAQDLDIAYANYRRRLAQMFGGSIPEALGNENLLKNQVLNQLIEERLLRQYAENKRYRIGNEQLNRIIRGMEVFQADGQFDAAIYNSQLGSLGYSTQGFEQELRRTQSMEQLRSGVQKTAFVIPQSAAEFAALTNQTRSTRVLVLPLDDESIEVSDDDIASYFEANRHRFMTPERIKIDYIELDLENIKSSIVVEESDLLARYEQSLETYTSNEIRTASHILLTLDSDASASDSDEVLARITELQLRIQNGEDFAELARQFSEDPGSAADGGNLGEIEPGVMVAAFEKALYALEPGQVSEPVKTSFGWHIIKLLEVSAGGTRPFESVRIELEDEIKTELAENQIYDLVENLANIVYEQPDSLLPAAEQLGLSIETSDWFDRSSGTGIAADNRIRNLAFSDEILSQGLNSEAIELADNRVAFIRLNELQASVQRPMEEVRDQIVVTLRAARAREANREAGEDSLQKLNDKTQTLDEIASQHNAEINDAGFISRNHTDLDRSIVQAVFSMRKPADGLVYDGITLSNGDFALIELSAVVSSNKELADEQLETLTTASSNSEYQSILKSLVAGAEIVRTPLESLE